jgi:hypothetical protein
VEHSVARRPQPDTDFQAALSDLYRIYWYALYAYVWRRGYTPEESPYLTQGFFPHLLEHKTFGRAAPLKGFCSGHYKTTFRPSSTPVRAVDLQTN